MLTEIELPKGFKEKLKWLVEHVKSPEGKSYTDKEIAEAIGKSANYIWRLRNDPTVNNPSLEVAEALAKFFGVGLGFFAEGEGPEDWKEMLDRGFFSEIALRASLLNELAVEDQHALLRIMDHMLKSQKD
jgi:transcriptional regulator with XRE-family HTH domain